MSRNYNSCYAKTKKGIIPSISEAGAQNNGQTFVTPSLFCCLIREGKIKPIFSLSQARNRIRL
jgi:hypothetical protein